MTIDRFTRLQTHFPSVADLCPADQLWIIAYTLELAGGPADHIYALRRLAERLEDLHYYHIPG